MAETYPLVSVISPTYNSEKYIKAAVDAVLAQTYPNIEIIIVDGYSKDRTRDVLEPYITAGKVTFIYQEDKGPGAARNTAIKHARGEFIALLDSDDIFLPTKIERQVAYLQEYPACDVCYCETWHFYDDEPNRLLRLDYQYYTGDEVFRRLLEKNFIAPSMLVLRRSAIDRIGLFDESYRRSEDWEYWIRLAYHGARFKLVPEALLKIRIHRSSYSHGWGVKTAEKQTSLRIFESLYREMSPEDRRRYHMQWLLWSNRAKLWYTYLGNHFPPLQWLYLWNQQQRLS